MNLEDFRNTGKDYSPQDSINEKIDELDIKKAKIKKEAGDYFSLDDQYRNEIKRNLNLMNKLENSFEELDKEDVENIVSQLQRSLERLLTLKNRFKNLTEEEKGVVVDVEIRVFEIDEKIKELESFIQGYENDFGLRNN